VGVREEVQVAREDVGDEKGLTLPVLFMILAQHYLIWEAG
jgi:hypothetical protein